MQTREIRQIARAMPTHNLDNTIASFRDTLANADPRWLTPFAMIRLARNIAVCRAELAHRQAEKTRLDLEKTLVL